MYDRKKGEETRRKSAKIEKISKRKKIEVEQDIVNVKGDRKL